MPIVSAICPSCNGTLSVDDSHKAGICNYCGNPFVIQEAINSFNVDYQVKTDNVSIYNSKNSMEDLIEKEKIYLEIEDFEKLQSLYDEMTDLYPTKYNGWWGNIYCASKAFTKIYSEENEKDNHNIRKDMDKWFSLVEKLAPNDIFLGLKKEYNEYQIKLFNFDIENYEKDLKKMRKKILEKEEYYRHEREFNDSQDRDRTQAIWIFFISLILSFFSLSSRHYIIGAILVFVCFNMGIYILFEIADMSKSSSHQTPNNLFSYPYEKEEKKLESKIEEKKAKIQALKGK